MSLGFKLLIFQGVATGATSYISINTLQISSRGPPRGNLNKPLGGSDHVRDVWFKKVLTSASAYVGVHRTNLRVTGLYLDHLGWWMNMNELPNNVPPRKKKKKRNRNLWVKSMCSYGWWEFPMFPAQKKTHTSNPNHSISGWDVFNTKNNTRIGLWSLVP